MSEPIEIEYPFVDFARTVRAKHDRGTDSHCVLIFMDDPYTEHNLPCKPQDALYHYLSTQHTSENLYLYKDFLSFIVYMKLYDDEYPEGISVQLDTGYDGNQVFFLGNKLYVYDVEECKINYRMYHQLRLDPEIKT